MCVCDSRRGLQSLRNSKVQDLIVHRQLSVLPSACHSHKLIPFLSFLFLFLSLHCRLAFIRRSPSLCFHLPASLLCKGSDAAMYVRERAEVSNNRLIIPEERKWGTKGEGKRRKKERCRMREEATETEREGK